MRKETPVNPEINMRHRYPTSNPLDRIFLGIANLLILFAGAVVLYYCVVTSINLPPYEPSAVAMFPKVQDAAPMNIVDEPSVDNCVRCIASVQVH